MCHPGPIATGVAGQVRSLYGSGGLLTEVEDQAKVKQRQSPQRVATLVLMAAYHNLDTCWIAQHPVLLLGAIYIPPQPPPPPPPVLPSTLSFFYVPSTLVPPPSFLSSPH